VPGGSSSPIPGRTAGRCPSGSPRHTGVTISTPPRGLRAAPAAWLAPRRSAHRPASCMHRSPSSRWKWRSRGWRYRSAP
jgi:hypothetical protein